MSSNPESQQPEVNIPEVAGERLIRGEVPLGRFLGLTHAQLMAIAQTGHKMLEAGKAPLALEIFEGLVAAAPQDTVFLTQLGATYMTLERMDDAFRVYDQALLLNSTNVDALVGRGEIHLRRGQVPEGLKDLSRAIEADPALKRRSTQRAHGTLLALKMQAEQAKAAPAPAKK
ncbi:tetratricopeptide repeat protein [Myxococcus sp. RHSTA-1-4]|uniref:tetratricopeptide repeat protein n=1 Tax=Myxococcus sp. RHSTA-1-4 TaxID=2874601 RepID=UPI001CBD4DAA